MLAELQQDVGLVTHKNRQTESKRETDTKHLVESGVQENTGKVIVQSGLYLRCILFNCASPSCTTI